MSHLKQRLILAVVFGIALAACGTQDTSQGGAGGESRVEYTEEGVLLVDRTGREWDVTHARDIYGMDPEYFNFGLGLGAIPSIDAPIVVDKTSIYYPKATTDVAVFGVNHNGEQRGYRVSDLDNHEVLNDIYPGEVDAHVAVTF